MPQSGSRLGISLNQDRSTKLAKFSSVLAFRALDFQADNRGLAAPATFMPALRAFGETNFLYFWQLNGDFLEPTDSESKFVRYAK